jgi:hypothetical protein
METIRFESLPFVQDILLHPAFNTLKIFAHHGTISCYQHTMAVAQLAYQWSRLLHLDYIAATRVHYCMIFYVQLAYQRSALTWFTPSTHSA